MSLTQIVPPGVEPITEATVWEQLRVGGDPSDRDLIADMIAAARARIDGPHGALGIALITQQWQLRLPFFPVPRLDLPLPPVQSIDLVTYVDAQGVTQMLDPAAYIVAGLGSLDGTDLYPAPGTTWPETLVRPDVVQVDFTTGFGDTPDAVPPDMRAWLRMTVAGLYDNRDSYVVGEPIRFVPGLRDLILQYKQFEF